MERQKSNLRPLDHKANALTTTLLSHPCCDCCHLNRNDFSWRRNSPMSLSGWRILAGSLFQRRGSMRIGHMQCPLFLFRRLVFSSQFSTTHYNVLATSDLCYCCYSLARHARSCLLVIQKVVFRDRTACWSLEHNTC